ncbi:MAG: xylulose kinase [Candidatus Ancillula sp.]|jgi:xylulokinase|nr:xylulose kinase [Candidatus Ancillula sp.]
MEKLFIAGVDTSTQSCKIVVRDYETGELLRSGSANHLDGTECHPDNWWDAFNEATKNAGGINDISAIAVGGQQHGMVLLDEDGEIIRPALLWNDTRSAVAACDLTSELGALTVVKSPVAHQDGKHISEIGRSAWAEAVGSALVASITITKIRWVAAEEPENARKIAAICLPHDWLSWRIAGYGPKSQGLNPDLKELFTDRSDASGTGYFDATADNGKGAYRRDLLELAFRPLGENVAKELSKNVILPRVLQPTEYYEAEKFIIGPGGGDNAAAALGLGLKTGEVSISLGTSGVVAAVSSTPTIDETGAINGFADCTGNYLPLACTLNASRDIDAGKAILDVDYDRFSELALESKPGAGGITLVPYFEGERMPNRPTANASLFGLTLENSTQPNIARAFVEGMLLGLNDGLVEMGKLGVNIEKIYIIGGSMKSPAVRQIAPAVFGRDITLPSAGEYVADGAARQAAWCLSHKLADGFATENPPHWKFVEEEVISASATPDVVEAYELVKGLRTQGELRSDKKLH